MTARQIRVLVVDDSPEVRATLRSMLAGPGIDVIATSAHGDEAVSLAIELRPDVVTMDVMMPGLDGIASIERLMLVAPTRVIVVTAAARAGTLTMRAIAAGALEIVGKPASWTGEGTRAWAGRLAETIALMADVPVVTRRAGMVQTIVGRVVDAVGIAASTGGPPVLAEILRPLRGRSFPPILIAQHLGQGFTDSLVRWLRETTGIPATAASNGQALAAGTLYFAPDRRDLVIVGGRLQTPPIDGLHHPCADRMFVSLAAAYGPRALGIILTGMGDDGASGLRAIRDARGLSIAQDPRTCVLRGMPNAALEARAVELVLDPRGIAASLFGISRAT